MAAVLRHLNANNGETVFSQLFDVNKGVAHVVVSFIALLELVKEGLVRFRQDDDFGEIFVFSHASEDDLGTET